MKNFIITFDKSETLNSKVENKKLSAQIYAAPIPDKFVKMSVVGGDIYVEYETILAQMSIDILQTVINDHDGEINPILDDRLMTQRRSAIRALIANAEDSGMNV